MMEKQDLLHPAYILWLIRQDIATSWQQLCMYFDLDPKRLLTGESMLFHAIVSLQESQLIRSDEVLDRSGGEIQNPQITFSVTSLLSSLQHTLNLSLTDLAFSSPYQRLIVNPIPHRAYSTKYKSDILVLMPFAAPLKPVYEDHISAVANSLSLKAARADDFFTTEYIVDEIWTAILDARILIADCTGRNPNVFYEIGLAHAVGKPIVLITQNADDIPFDLRHRRYLLYELTPRGMKTFEESLKKTIETTLEESKQ